MTWIVREGRTTRYLYVCRQEAKQTPKLAEVDLWEAKPEEAVLMAAAPKLLEAAKVAVNDRLYREWPEVAQLLIDAIAAAETPFVQTYKPNVSAE